MAIELARKPTRTVLESEFFGRRELPDAMKAAIKHAKKGGLVAPMYLLMTHWPYKGLLAAGTEELSGIDKEGVFTNAGEPVVITLNYGRDGNGVLTPKILRKARKLQEKGQGGLKIDYLVDLERVFPNQDVITSLLQGKMPDKTDIPLSSYNKLCKDGPPVYNFERHAIVTPLKTRQQTTSGYSSITDPLDEEGHITDPQVILYADGKKPAEAFINRAKTNDRCLGLWHIYNEKNFDLEKSQGFVTSLGCHLYSSLGCEHGIFGTGFIGVAQDALATWENARPGLAVKDILKAVTSKTEKFVRPKNREAYNEVVESAIKASVPQSEGPWRDYVNLYQAQ